ncbi:MAG: hypothetical protein LBR61_06230 [Synergistaceae bacterium]|jgi:hypothetical protein|nr:hypothetical protein [Synergistaceae bacterium]
MDNETYIIAQADKQVLKISGLSVKGLDTRRLEAILSEKVGSVVRVIGVTGSSIEMDIYGVPDEQVLRNERGFVEALALAEGITISDLTAVTASRKIIPADFADMPPDRDAACAAERWMPHKEGRVVKK